MLVKLWQKSNDINKPFARKIQILTVGEQRAKVMGKAKVASIFKKEKTVKKQLGKEEKHNATRNSNK